MKEDSINKYDRQVREGIADRIAKLIASKSAKKAIEKAKKLAPDDESMKAEMDSLKAQYERLEKALENMCKRVPDHPDCKDGSDTKNKFRWY